MSREIDPIQTMTSSDSPAGSLDEFMDEENDEIEAVAKRNGIALSL